MPEGYALNKLLLVDLEATCWETEAETPNEPPLEGVRVNEIIEIGAVLFDLEKRTLGQEYQRFVKPSVRPNLSDFCMRLTTIGQANVDQADNFAAVLNDFTEQFSITGGAGDPWFASWGAYDRRQVISDCIRNAVSYPFDKKNHVNVKTAVTRLLHPKKRGLQAVLHKLGLSFEGVQHRALVDAKNIGRILAALPDELYLAFTEQLEVRQPTQKPRKRGMGAIRT